MEQFQLAGQPADLAAILSPLAANGPWPSIL